MAVSHDAGASRQVPPTASPPEDRARSFPYGFGDATRSAVDRGASAGAVRAQARSKVSTLIPLNNGWLSARMLVVRRAEARSVPLIPIQRHFGREGSEQPASPCLGCK